MATARRSWDDSGAGESPPRRRSRSRPWKVTPQDQNLERLLGQESCWIEPRRARAQASLQGERYIDTVFPTGNASSSRVARNSARERWSGRNQPQTCRTQAGGYPRRGIAPQPCAQEKQNSGPYCIQCPNWLVTSSMVRKDSPRAECGKAEESGQLIQPINVMRYRRETFTAPWLKSGRASDCR